MVIQGENGSKKKTPTLFGVPLNKTNDNLFKKEPLFKFDSNSIFGNNNAKKENGDEIKADPKTSGGLFSFKKIEDGVKPSIFGENSIFSNKTSVTDIKDIFSKSNTSIFNTKPDEKTEATKITNPFASNNTGSLFGKDSIFNTDGKKTDLFGFMKKEGGEEQNKLLFNFNTNREDKKEGSDNDDNDDDNEVQRSDSPEHGIKEDETSLFMKKVNLSVESFSVYNKEDKVYKNKGSGKVSIEKSKQENTKTALLILRYFIFILTNQYIYILEMTQDLKFLREF